ncbi:MAG TPA: hypothetical protein VG204_04955 [Terriglobia bacterium]|nr:hypothetical protein [Terriglobia bacterium]
MESRHKRREIRLRPLPNIAGMFLLAYCVLGRGDVRSGLPTGRGTYALYGATSGSIVETVAEPSVECLLPQGAKSPAQIEDESVPTSAALTQERTVWIAKLLREIGKIKPGMRRKDLLKVFTTEGGLSNRFQRTYVQIECPYIKVDVRFKAANDEHDVLREDPEDVIETISRPYLAWSVADQRREKR